MGSGMERLWGRGRRGLGSLRSLELMMKGASVLIASTSAASGVVTWVGLELGLGLGLGLGLLGLGRRATCVHTCLTAAPRRA